MKTEPSELCNVVLSKVFHSSGLHFRNLVMFYLLQVQVFHFEIPTYKFYLTTSTKQHQKQNNVVVYKES